MTESAIRQALASIPTLFVDALLSEFVAAQKSSLRGDWETVGLKAGKICEISYCIVEGICSGNFATQIAKPADMQSACRRLEQQTQNGAPRSARIQIPRVIAATYELRNNRAIGHASGEISPNRMDGLFFRQAINWIVSELIRLDGRMKVEDTQRLIDGLNLRWSAAIWENDGRKRLLMQGLDRKDSVLAILYFSDFSASLSNLRNWLEVKNITNFIDRQLKPLHSNAMIDFDPKKGVVSLLPPGIEYFENKHLKSMG